MYIRVSPNVLGWIDVTGVQGGAPPRNADLRGDRSRLDLCRCGHSRSMWGPQHPLQEWRYLQCRCLHLLSLYRWQISAWGALSEACCGGSNCMPGNHPNTGRFGSRGQSATRWSSWRQKLHLGMARALPVKASLYRRGLVTDQLTSFRARASPRNWRS